MPRIDAQTVETLCAVAGIDASEDERRVLAGMLERHIAAFATVERLDLQEVAPADTFRPDWDA